jgi:hypothetical protein
VLFVSEKDVEEASLADLLDAENDATDKPIEASHATLSTTGEYYNTGDQNK